MTKLVYILAASHSGSTLLTMLLNAHPDVATVGELAPGHVEDLAFYRCSCGRLLRECPFWDGISRETRDQGVPCALDNFPTRFSLPESRLGARLLRPLHRGPVLEWMRDRALSLLPTWPRRFAQAAHANEAIIHAVLDYYGARVFVDKGNKALRLKFLLRTASFDVKVIRLIRDGRAVALTYTAPAEYADATSENLRGGGSGGQRDDERLSMAQAAWQWRRCNEEAEHALVCLAPSQWTQVRYEDLCSDPDATLNRLFTFLGLDPASRVRDFRSAEHHILGNGMRLDSTSDIRLDERWKPVLTGQDQAAFDRTAGRMNREYGYS